MSNDFTPTLAGTIASAPTTPGTVVPGTRLRITHIAGSLSGKTQELAGGVVSIGRHPDSQIRYDHTVDFLVSTRHGQLSYENGHWSYADTNSTNGSYINGNRVQKQVLTSGTIVMLGMPNAPGGAAFRVEMEGAGPAQTAGAHPSDATIPDHHTPFAQEPPSADEAVSFNCARCGVPNVAPHEQAGEMVICKACGKPTRVPPVGFRPAAQASPAEGQATASPVPLIPGPQVTPVAASQPSPRPAPPSVAPPPISAPPIPAHAAAPVVPPAAKPPEKEQGFFGGIIGGIKSNLQRRRERKEIQRELAALEEQIPQLETDLRQASIRLGQELWQLGKDRLGSFRAANRLNEFDATVANLDAKQADIDREFGERTNDYQEWLAEWQDQAAKLDAELSAANQSLAEAQVSLAKAKEAVIVALASRAENLTAAAQRANELANEAKTDPQDDFWQRYTQFIEESAAKAEELKLPIAELPDLIAARHAARNALDAATARQLEASADVQESKKERTENDAAHAEVQRVYQQAQASHRAEVEKTRAQAPPQHADLGRQYLETPDAPQFTPAPPPLSSARAALDRLNQTKAMIAQKRQRLAELEAG